MKEFKQSLKELAQRFRETKKTFLLLCVCVLCVFLTICAVSYLFYTPYVEREPVGQATPPEKVTPVQQSPTHFAEVDKDGTVLRVIVADQEFIDSGLVGSPENWVPTDPEGKSRANYAARGGKYFKKEDAFVSKRPNPNATFNSSTMRWEVELDEVTRPRQ